MLKLNLNKDSAQEIFGIPSNPIAFLGIDAGLEGVFRVSVVINPFKAMMSMISSLDIEVFPSPNSQTQTTTLPDDPGEAINNIIGRFSETVLTHQLFEETKIAETSLDITAFINNGLGMSTPTIGGNIVAPVLTQNLREVSVRKTKTYTKVADSSDQIHTDSRPIVSVIRSSVTNNIIATADIATNCEAIIAASHTDPAAILNFDFPALYEGESAGGTIGADNRGAFRMIGSQLEQKIRAPTSRAYNHVHASLDGLIGLGSYQDRGMNFRNSLSTISSMSPSPEVIIRKFIRPKYHTMSAILKIRSSQIAVGPLVYVRFRCKSAKGVPIQEKFYQLNIATFFQDKERPELPPTIHVANNNGGIIKIRVSQQDPYGEKIIVYKRVLQNIASAPLEYASPMQVLTTVVNKKSDGETQIIDENGAGKRILYRAYALGKNGIQGRNFSGTVSLPDTSNLGSNLGSKLIRERKVAKAVFSTTVGSVGITVKVRAFCYNALACFLEARDITGLTQPDIFRIAPRIVGSTPHDQQRTVRYNDELTFIDNEVQFDRKYHYSLVVIKSDSTKVALVGSIIKTFTRPMQGFDIVIADQKTSPSVTEFNLGIKSSTAGLEGIVEQLKRIGADESYIDDIKNSKTEFSSLFRFAVDRADMSTGVIERMGVFLPGTFIDNATLAGIRGVSTTIPGHSYDYEITALRMDPYTLLFGSKIEDKDETTLKNFTRDMRKFRNPRTLKNATLPSNQSLLKAIDNPDFSIDDQFLEGDTGVVKHILISVPTKSVSLGQVSVGTDASGANIISWPISGNGDLIDYFIVFCDVGGIKAPIGTVVNLGIDDLFFFRDDKTAGIVGTKTYTVLPIFVDFTSGKESEGRSITKLANLSEIEARE